MSEEHPKERGWIGLVTTLAVLVVGLLFSWLGWMSITIIGMKSKLEILSFQQRDVIPPVVETSLREIRSKTNEQMDQVNNARADIQLIQKDLIYIKEQVNRP